MVGDNYRQVLSEVKESAVHSNRKEDDVTLIAVSKTKPVELLQEVYDAGARDFGENKVQEIIAKYDKLPSDIRWHMIGHLQTNKVKYIADKVYMIHSVDSVKLAEVISKEALKVGRVIPVLIEVNVAAEESKFGISVEECENFIRSIHHLPGISIKGLMTQLSLKRSVILRLVKELKDAGYISFSQEHEKSGKFTAKTWKLYEKGCEL